MKIHYFQRYHSKENVDTANTMLLLSRLYTYSPDKFFKFMKQVVFSEESETEIMFYMQEKCKDSIPDAIIMQPSFKVVVETKLYGQFNLKQLINHLESFKNEEYKVLLTLDPKPINKNFKQKVDDEIAKYNLGQEYPVFHRNLTFETIMHGVKEIIDERDYEMMEVLEDYENYCYEEGLITDEWKRMRVQLAGTTLKDNLELNLYYDNYDRGFSGHDYIGLYSQKSVRAIGKIKTIVVAERSSSGWEFATEKGEFSPEMKELILEAVERAKAYGYNMNKERYFFVEKFYETDYKKVTPRAPMGSRMFDLTEVLGVDKLPDIFKISELLRNETWT